MRTQGAAHCARPLLACLSFACGSLACLPLACLLAGAALAGEPVSIDQKDRAFSQAEVSIHAGDTIRFNNKDDFGHQVYADGAGLRFDTDETDPGEHVDVTFPNPGHYTVLCHIHPKMRIGVDVK